MSKPRIRPEISVTRSAATAILEEHRDGNSGRAFTVAFTKRSDGTKRVMNCRYGVVCKLKGGTAPFNFADKGLHSVYDLEAHDYRSLPLEGVEKITLNGVVYNVN
jgi:hypothetical protein